MLVSCESVSIVSGSILRNKPIISIRYLYVHFVQPYGLSSCYLFNSPNFVGGYAH